MNSEKLRSAPPSTPSDYLDSILSTDFDSPTAVSPATERVEWLRITLGDLTPKQRFVVECAWGLRDEHRYSLREIAGFMGVTMQAAWKHYHLGMRKLDHGCQLRDIGKPDRSSDVLRSAA